MDFTYSPYIAVYFALGKNTEERNTHSPTIYAFDMTEFRVSASRQDTRIPRGNGPLGDRDDHRRTLEEVILKNQVDLLVPVAPACMPARMKAQQGMFLCAGNVDRSFLENLNEMDCANEKAVRKFRLRFRPEERAKALDALQDMGITSDRLFQALPELKKVAEAVDGIDGRHMVMDSQDNVDVSDGVAITMTLRAASKVN